MDNSASRCVQKKSHRTGLRSPRPGGASVFEPPLSETPSSKPQAPEKFPISSPKPQKTDAGANGALVGFELGLGASLELGVWNLELFAWALSFSKIEMRPRPGVLSKLHCQAAEP